MENVRELLADSTRAILSGLGIQQRERARALRNLARVRREARDEIGRLIQFLGASDPYVMTELEGRYLAVAWAPEEARDSVTALSNRHREVAVEMGHIEVARSQHGPLQIAPTTRGPSLLAVLVVEACEGRLVVSDQRPKQQCRRWLLSTQRCDKRRYRRPRG